MLGNYSISTSKNTLSWVAIGAFMVVIAANAIVNTKWLYLGALLCIPLLIYIYFKRNPFVFLFGLYAFLLPLDTILLPGVSGELSGLIKYFGLLTVLLLGVKGFMENKFNRPDTTVLWWILLSLYSLLTLVWGIEQHPALFMIRNIIGLLIFYLIVSSYKTDSKDYEIIKLFIISGGVVLSLLTIQSYGTLLESATSIKRVSIVIGDNQFTDQNFVALSLLLPVSMTLEKVLGQGIILKKLLHIVILGSIIFAILLTGSRGGMVGAGVIFSVYFLLSRKKKDFLTFVIPLLILIISIAPSFLFDRWEMAAETGGAGRTTIWHIGLKALQKYWLTGAGLSSFPNAYTEFVDYGSKYVGIDRAAHNTYLQMFVELGIIGFILMIIGFARHYKAINPTFYSTKYDFDSIMLKASFWSLLVASFFSDNFWNKQMWLFWMLIMIRKNALNNAGALYYTR
jgi:O-antigen ligase